jgi:nucleoid-associated protein YgaU
MFELDNERSFDTLSAMTRTRVRRRRLAAVVLLAFLGGMAVARAAGQAEPPMHRVSHTTYVVRPGDTLWGIATRHSPEEDPLALIDSIERANDVEAGSLVPGQMLLIPAA